MKPRASIPTTLVTPSSANGPTMASTAARKRIGVGQQRGDVLEDDAGLRQVRDVSDE